ncbi:MAG: ComF family protein [Candidatus Paceibacterota bacterium]
MKRTLLSFLSFLFPPSLREEKAKNIVLSSLPRNTKQIETPKDSFALLNYRSKEVREVVWLIKYRGDEKAAKEAGVLLAEVLAEEIAEKQQYHSFLNPLVIPVPLSHARLRSRGFNQSARIAKAFAKELELPYSPSVLEKTKNTKSQTELSHKERRENVKGVFSVSRPEHLKGRDIILIDDVITTGSTMEEARTVLLERGADRVWCVALAH